MLGEDLYRTTGELAELGAKEILIAGLYNPDFYVKNNEVAHFEQVLRMGEGAEIVYIFLEMLMEIQSR